MELDTHWTIALLRATDIWLRDPQIQIKVMADCTNGLNRNTKPVHTNRFNQITCKAKNKFFKGKYLHCQHQEAFPLYKNWARNWSQLPSHYT